MKTNNKKLLEKINKIKRRAGMTIEEEKPAQVAEEKPKKKSKKNIDIDNQHWTQDTEGEVDFSSIKKKVVEEVMPDVTE